MYFVPVGSAISGSSRRLSQASAKKLVATLKTSFDKIIVDCPNGVCGAAAVVTSSDLLLVIVKIREHQRARTARRRTSVDRSERERLRGVGTDHRRQER